MGDTGESHKCISLVAAVAIGVLGCGSTGADETDSDTSSTAGSSSSGASTGSSPVTESTSSESGSSDNSPTGDSDESSGSGGSTGSQTTPPLPDPCEAGDFRVSVDLLEAGVVADGTDQTGAIQAVIDAAPDHAVIYLPDLGQGNFILINGTLRLDRPITLLGAGRNAFSELRAGPGYDRSMIVVASSDVTIEGLRLIGPGYVGWANANAIDWSASVDSPRTNITYRNNHIEDWTDVAINMRWFEDTVVECNTIRRCTYAGIFVSTSHRVAIRHNDVRDIAEPDSGGTALNGDGTETIAYPIVLTSAASIPGEPASDALIHDNYVEKSQWNGILNHGCHRFLAFDNHLVDQTNALQGVADSTFPYWFEDHYIVNNTIENNRNYGGALTTVTRGFFIGNHFIGTSGRTTDIIRMYGNTQNTWTYGNRADLADVTRAWRIYTPGGFGPNEQYTFGRNFLNGVDTDPVLEGQASPAAPPPTPPAPGEFVARAHNNHQGGTDVMLTWANNAGEDHDSFEIEWSEDGLNFTPFAFRPPDRVIFRFDMPTHSSFEPYDPQAYRVKDHQLGGTFRIRTNHGLSSSAWTQATVE